MTVRMSWEEVAACRGADPDLFFPVGAAGLALPQIQEAERICRGLPGIGPLLGLGTGPGGRLGCTGRDHGGQAARHPPARAE